jgi:DNA-binding LacI/PurR family transcriptional regulator
VEAIELGKIGLFVLIVTGVYYVVNLVLKPEKTIFRILIGLFLTALAYFLYFGIPHVTLISLGILSACLVIVSIILAVSVKVVYNKNTKLQEQIVQLKAEVQIAKTKLPIAIFVPRSENGQGDFWMEFTSHVIQELQEKGYQQKVVYLQGNFLAREQIRLLKNFEWKTVAGAILSLADVTVADTLIDVIKNLGTDGPPIVLHDLAPAVASKFFANIESLANLVCVNNEVGGSIAADIMLDYFTHKQFSPPYNIVVVPGHSEHPHSKLRIDGFRTALELKGVTSIPAFTGDGKWTYEGASEAFRLFTSSREQGVGCIHGIFVCNDDMALGVEDYLLHSKESIVNYPAIIGFDKTHLLEQRWRSLETHLIIGTVDARLQEQAMDAADLVIELVEKKSSIVRQRDITPRRVTRTGWLG